MLKKSRKISGVIVQDAAEVHSLQDTGMEYAVTSYNPNSAAGTM